MNSNCRDNIHLYIYIDNYDANNNWLLIDY